MPVLHQALLNTASKLLSRRVVHPSQTHNLVKNSRTFSWESPYDSDDEGLSVLQGGPPADFLDSVLQHTEDGEGKRQFVEGLKKTGIMQLMAAKSTIKYLFRPSAISEALTVNRLLHLFIADFAPEGSSRRVQQEASYRHFVRYLREIYAGSRGGLTLAHILKFATGASKEPVLGFAMQPTIHFTDGVFPVASTCVNKLSLPIENMNSDKYDLAFLNDYFGLE